MDILFLESNTFILEDLRIKLMNKLKDKKNSPLIFFNQLDVYAEKGIGEHQKKVLIKLIKNNKVVVIYIRQNMVDLDTYDSFYLEVLKDLVVFITLVDVQRYLDDEYILDMIFKIYKKELK